MTEFVSWLRGLADKGGKGVVNNIDARCLGRIADALERGDAISKLNHHRAGIIERSMDMLGDVPGETLEDRLTRLQGWYMEMQILVGDLKHKLEVAEAVCRLSALDVRKTS